MYHQAPKLPRFPHNCDTPLSSPPSYSKLRVPHGSHLVVTLGRNVVTVFTQAQAENQSCRHHRMVERANETVSSVRLHPSMGSMRVVKNEANVHPDRAVLLLGLFWILDRAS